MRAKLFVYDPFFTVRGQPVHPAVAVQVQRSGRTVLVADTAITEMPTAQDLAEIATIQAQGRVPEGDVYTLERDRDGRHGSIMKYNLNAAS